MITFDPESLKDRIAELEAEMGRPGFWDDQQHAASVSTEHARLSRRLERYDRLRGDFDDAAELAAMDGDMDAEIAESIEPLRRELARLQEEALFNGEYDAGDAIVSIVAGTGGTDAQDWAEILLRMYLRWAAERGFQEELLEASPGRRPGSSRPRSPSRARTHTARSRRSAASTASSACRRSTRPTAGTRRSRR